MTQSSLLCRAALLASCLAVPAAAAPHVILRVSLPAAAAGPASGRVLLFATPVQGGKLPNHVDAGAFDGAAMTVAAQEIASVAPGAGVDIDADTQAYPAGFSALKPGDYALQAVLDTRHDYAYGGRAAGDLASPVVRFTVGGAGAPDLVLDQTVPAADPWVVPDRAPPIFKTLVAAAKANTHAIDFTSPALSKFWGRPMPMRGWVLTPPGYDSKSPKTYPTVYYTHGFGGTVARLILPLAYVNAAIVKGEMPPMIWVFLDESSPTGTHEFADSVNNGPWGQALTTELIPALEKQYRMDGKVGSRFLNGHSSGGWATLWLQTRYPSVFGGTWSTSPDPSDFHDFTGIDLYAGGNAYHRADGTAYPIMRDKGKVLSTFQQFAQLEVVEGSSGGQIASFDWVFSPRGAQGAPVPMFDRVTGVIDPAVVAYWHDHYDIAHVVSRDWPTLKKDLTGKVHVIVGDADTFYLDGAAHKLQAVLDGLHAGAHFTYLPGRTHFDLYAKDGDRQGLLKDIAWEMYAQARPGSGLKRVVAPPK